MMKPLEQSDLARRWPAIACYLRRHGLPVKDIATIVIRSEREVEKLFKQVDLGAIEEPRDQWTMEDPPRVKPSFARENPGE